MEAVKNHIRTLNWQAILEWGCSLKEEERHATMVQLTETDLDKEVLKQDEFNQEGTTNADFYRYRGQTQAALCYAIIVCTRGYDDLESTRDIHYNRNTALYSYLFSPAIGYEPLIQFFTLFPPNYLDRFLKEVSTDRFFNADFKTLWKLSEKGWLRFDEAFFTRRLFTLYHFDHDHEEDTQFLLDHPEAIEKVFLPFYRYDLPLLDLIKCKSIPYNNGLSARANVYWTEVIKILLSHQMISTSLLATQLLESLLNNWKKPRLDWHIRLLDLLQPGQTIFLEQQHLLFAALQSNHISIINYAVKAIQAIHQEKTFRSEDLLAHVSSVLVKEKCEKPIGILLSILDDGAAKHPALQQGLPELLSLVLLQPNAEVQAQAAALLVKYTAADQRAVLVLDYLPALKQKARKILNVKEIPATPTAEETSLLHVAVEMATATVPADWNELLFHIGNCIRTKSACDIDLLIEGINQLQDKIPEDYVKQLKPYTKQLTGKFHSEWVMAFLTELLNSWITKENPYTSITPDNNSSIPFLGHKCRLLYAKLAAKNKLPFLSTPTHLPFFIHPTVLIDRLRLYEQQQVEADMEDLIIATNRILKCDIDKETIAKAKSLKGIYAEAIQYLLGISTEIIPATWLPLWTQITRTHNPDGIFDIYQTTTANNYPAVSTPFITPFSIEADSNGIVTWYRLLLNEKWNAPHYMYRDDKVPVYPSAFHYTAPSGRAHRADILYQLSLVPHYADTLIARYIPITATGNEVQECEYCQYPLQMILENKLHVHHSGWIYIAVCLLFEKSVSRDLAAEYIHFSLESKLADMTYLTEVTARLIMQKYAPVNRWILYMDRVGAATPVKHFQLQVMAQCILQATANNVPVNFKKIIAYYLELTSTFGIIPDEQIAQQIKIFQK